MTTSALTTRRSILRATAGAGLFLLPEPLVFAASDFWTKKEPAEWSPDEIKLLQTKSPWAKKVRGEMSGGGPTGANKLDASGASAPGSRSPNINAANMPRGGGGGGDDSPPAEARSPEGPEVVIRWESSKALRSASKQPLPPEMDNRYTISMTGLPPLMIRLGLGRGGRGRGRGDAAPPAPQDDAARQKAEINQILSEATLTVKGHDPQTADVLFRTNDGMFLFGFPKQNLPLAPTDKEILFMLKLGVLTIKAKFEPKEMMFSGQLAV